MDSGLINNKIISQKFLLASSFLWASFLLLIYTFFEPRWQTNDDVAMSMLAHGYGIASAPSSTILFSNVIWGYIVRSLPTLNGVLGYSSATIFVIFVSGLAIIYYSAAREYSIFFFASIFLLLMLYPILFPQFTINSGIASVSSILLLRIYCERRQLRFLMLSFALAITGFLVRSVEFYLVILVALPILPLRMLLTDRATKYALAFAILTMGLAGLVDRQAYNDDAWQAYNKLNPVRAAFTDFGADASLKMHPDIMAKYGYTANDVDLITNWFFTDPQVADPEALQAMLAELGPLHEQANALGNAWIGIRALWNPALLAPLAAALILALASKSWRVLGCWLLCIAVIFVLGLIGRPGILRVYIPIVDLLVIAPLAVKRSVVSNSWLLIGPLLVLALLHSAYFLNVSKELQYADEEVRSGLAGFPSDPVVIWGDTFPYEAVYPVLRASPSVLSFRHYGMGTSTLAPFTLAYAEAKAGRNMTKILQSGDGVPMMATSAFVALLSNYCRERLKGELSEVSTTQFGQLAVSRYRCGKS